MVRFATWLARNADAVVALVLALFVGLIGLGFTLDPQVVSGATLLTLGLLATSILRDRYRRTPVEEELRDRLRTADGVLAALPGRLDRLDRFESWSPHSAGHSTTCRWCACSAAPTSARPSPTPGAAPTAGSSRAAPAPTSVRSPCPSASRRPARTSARCWSAWRSSTRPTRASATVRPLPPVDVGGAGRHRRGVDRGPHPQGGVRHDPGGVLVPRALRHARHRHRPVQRP